jgi:hypothetical protein
MLPPKQTSKPFGVVLLSLAHDVSIIFQFFFLLPTRVHSQLFFSPYFPPLCHFLGLIYTGGVCFPYYQCSLTIRRTHSVFGSTCYLDPHLRIALACNYHPQARDYRRTVIHNQETSPGHCMFRIAC